MQWNKQLQRFLQLPSIAIEPSLVADKDERVPRNPPVGVRATPTTQTSIGKKKIRSIRTSSLQNFERSEDNKINVSFCLYYA